MEKNTVLTLTNLSVSVFDKQVVQDLCLVVDSGTIHAIMGPNGSGKSSLAYALAGHPDYVVTAGSVLFGADDLCSMAPDERAKKGLFLAFQNPCEIPGVSVVSFLREAYMAVKGVHVSV